ILDIKISTLAHRHKLYYTRYADDITFSTNQKEFPSSIAYEDKGIVVIGHALNSIIQKHGFKINTSKNRLQYKNSRQDVTGLIVNTKINIRNEYRNRVRVLWHKVQNGKEIYAIQGDKDDKKN